MKKPEVGTMKMRQISLGLCPDVPVAKRGRPTKKEKDAAQALLFKRASEHSNVIPVKGKVND